MCGWTGWTTTSLAARNLLLALDLSPDASAPVDPTIRAELIEGRDLHEHWADNMPVFMVMPGRQIRPAARESTREQLHEKTMLDRSP
jgi:hypothetical protein